MGGAATHLLPQEAAGGGGYDEAAAPMTYCLTQAAVHTSAGGFGVAGDRFCHVCRIAHAGSQRVL